MRQIQWPDRPTCHDDDYQALSFGEASWRPPTMDRQPLAQPFRSCSYCGSIHPEDLLGFLLAGARFQSSDWKYGWPHKFYVEGIPNPLAGQIVRVGGILPGGKGKTQAEIEAENPGFENWRINERGNWEADRLDTAPVGTFAKWYNIHLLDLDLDGAFASVAGEIVRRTGVLFTLVDEKLRYQAPRSAVPR